MPFKLTNPQLLQLSKNKNVDIKNMALSVIVYKNNPTKELKSIAMANFMKLPVETRQAIENMENGNKPKTNNKAKKR